MGLKDDPVAKVWPPLWQSPFTYITPLFLCTSNPSGWLEKIGIFIEDILEMEVGNSMNWRKKIEKQSRRRIHFPLLNLSLLPCHITSKVWLFRKAWREG